MSRISDDGYSKKEIEELNERFKGKNIENITAGSNMTIHNKSSGPRMNMHSTHLEQKLMLIKPENKKVFTGFETVYGEYTSSRLKAKSNYSVINVIEKFIGNRFIYYMVVYDLDNNLYDVIEISHYDSLTEDYGFIKKQLPTDYTRIKNTFIQKGEILFESPNHDEFGNYMYGINAITGFISNSFVKEDGKIISKSLAKRLAFNKVYSINVVLNTNDVLLNMFGDDDNYKMFPDIGEQCNGYICIKRKISNKTAPFEMNKKILSKKLISDTVYYVSGNIIDIDVYVNEESELYKHEHREQISKYYEYTKLFHTNMFMTLHKIISNKKNKCSINFSYFYNKSKDYLDSNKKFVYNKDVFEFAMLRFHVLKTVIPEAGYKITGTAGDKGIIVDVWDDDRMPIDENNVICEMIESPLGIPGRANILQLYSHEINFVSSHIETLIKKEDNIDKKLSILKKYLDIISPFQSKELIIYYNKLSVKKKKSFWDDININGIFVHQSSFYDNAQLEKHILKLYETYNVKPTKVSTKIKLKYFNKPIKLESERPIILAKKYIMLLKQIPDGKFSVRAAGNVNMMGQPTKTNRKETDSVFSDTPIKISPLIIFNMMTRISPETIQRLLQTHALNPGLRQQLSLSLMLDDPFWTTDIKWKKSDRRGDYSNIAVTQFKALCYALGLDLKTKN